MANAIMNLVRPLAREALARIGHVAVPQGEWEEARRLLRVRRQDMAEMEALYRAFLLPALPEDRGRDAALFGLYGTTIGEGLHILEALHKALASGAAGDVCEFGCNEGHTSRLIAREILAHAPGRTLWLYDSFEGLPPPSEKDRLIDDIAGRGSMAAYAGDMRAREDQVRDKLAEVHFPAERRRVVKGWIDKTLAGPEVPGAVAFAYVDFDFYEPIRLALAFLDHTMGAGGWAVVDDYGFFSEGAQLAVDEFVAASGGRWVRHMPHPAAGKFCLLERVEG